MRFFENIVESVLGTARFMAGLWFVGIFAFGLLMTWQSQSGYLWGTTPEAMEAREEAQRLRIAADERKAQLANQRALSEDGWGSGAAAETRISEDSQRSASARRRDMRAAREMREAGWGR